MRVHCTKNNSDFATRRFRTLSVSLRPINGPASFAIVIDHIGKPS